MPLTVAPERRDDLPVEGLFLLDGSGNLTTQWYDSKNAYKLRIVAYFLNGVAPSSTVMEEAIYDGTGAGAGSTPRIVRSQALTVISFKVAEELDVSARYYRFVVSGGDPNDYVALSAREV